MTEIFIVSLAAVVFISFPILIIWYIVRFRRKLTLFRTRLEMESGNNPVYESDNAIYRPANIRISVYETFCVCYGEAFEYTAIREIVMQKLLGSVIVTLRFRKRNPDFTYILMSNTDLAKKYIDYILLQTPSIVLKHI